MTPNEIANLRDQCLQYESRTELLHGNPALYQRVRYHKLTGTCFAHMPVNRRRWTIEELVRESRKYETRSEMLADNPALYQAIKRRGLSQLLPPSRRNSTK